MSQFSLSLFGYDYIPSGSPLQFFVDAVNSGVVTAYGSGLSFGMVNKAATFTVVTKNAGEGTKPDFHSDVCYFPVHLRKPLLHCSKVNIWVLVFSLSGGLSLAVEGPSKAEITCKDNKDGTCTVSYLPTAPGDYNIIVKFDNKHISGSPFTAKITGEDINNFSRRPFFMLSYQISQPLFFPLYLKGMTP